MHYRYIIKVYKTLFTSYYYKQIALVFLVMLREHVNGRKLFFSIKMDRARGQYYVGVEAPP